MMVDLIDRVNTYNVPVTDLCCFYFDLESGCYIIGVTCLFTAMGIVNVDISSISSCFPSFEVRYVLALSKALNFNLFFIALYFLYGLKKKRIIPIKVFLLMLTTFILFYFIETLVLFFTKYVAYKFCPTPRFFATAHCINVVVYSYFTVVVNSYLRVVYPIHLTPEIEMTKQNLTSA